MKTGILSSLVRVGCLVLVLAAPIETGAGALSGIQTVFLVVLENFNWATIKNSTNAPYLTGTLVPQAARAEQYYNPPGLHPSLPNYLWLEAGTNFGVTSDFSADALQIPSTQHLATLLDGAGVSWRGYFENLPTNGPTHDVYPYISRHNPFVFFRDVNQDSAYVAAHIRPYEDLETDLRQHAVARYNFVIPNLCDDMHDACGAYADPIRAGDDWLAREMPKLLNSDACREGGVVLLLWDEGDDNISDGPIGLLVFSPLAKGNGYSNTNYYTHSSMLRTVQEIFGVTPLLGDAVNAADLSDFFHGAPVLIEPRATNAQIRFTLLTGGPRRTNEIQVSTDSLHWTPLISLVSTSVSTLVSDSLPTNGPPRYYRAIFRGAAAP